MIIQKVFHICVCVCVCIKHEYSQSNWMCVYVYVRIKRRMAYTYIQVYVYVCVLVCMNLSTYSPKTSCILAGHLASIYHAVVCPPAGLSVSALN